MRSQVIKESLWDMCSEIRNASPDESNVDLSVGMSKLQDPSDIAEHFNQLLVSVQ